MMAKPVVPVERLLTVVQVAELLGTTERFPRRLIAERRIGSSARSSRPHSESAVREFIAAGLVEPVTVHSRGGRVVA